ncbi:MAG TPA: DNA gyrase inhibitor YacG [Rhodocyclaceae bacterium]|nr:DNA gyrase inhibitor YacG [Rhodocyclaceae bacterium]
MSERKPAVVSCPTCGKQVEWRTENTYRPFCCERCKQIDLGAWANEEYQVPASDSDPGGADGGDAMGAGGSR